MALTDSLEAYYSMDDVTDDTANGYDLTNKNTVAFNTGHIGDAADYGTADNKCLHRNADVLSFSQFGTAWSFNFWIYPTEVGTNTNRILRYILNDGTNERNGQLDINTSGKLNGGIFQNTGSNITGSTTLTADAWQMATYIFTGTQLKLYLDASSDATPVSAGFSTYARNIYSEMAIGAEMLNSGDTPVIGFDGLIDEVGIWSKELSESEMTDLYNGGDGLAYPLTVGGQNSNFLAFM